jgi:hypothetical protein
MHPLLNLRPERLPHPGVGIVVSLAVLVISLSACNLRRQPPPSPAEIIYTAAAQTLQAQSAVQLTQAGQPKATTAVPGQPVPSATPTAPTQTAAPTPTLTPTVVCDQARFVEDVSIPDDSEFTPGATFTKTWRLQNTGTCTWTTDYRLVVSGKDALDAPERTPLSKIVLPGESIEVSVNLSAPGEPGAYKTEFLLMNARGGTFGIGGPSKTIWVQIKVTVLRGLVYDFLASASQARWFAGVPNGDEVDIDFNGPDDSSNGAAGIKDGVKLENGATSGKILLTFPLHKNRGYLYGRFPAYTIQPGDHFKARLGFMTPYGGCGEGEVVFQLKIQEEGQVRTIQEWEKACDKRLLAVDLDLTAYKGRTVRFILAVQANGSYQDDWAIWNSARLEN